MLIEHKWRSSLRLTAPKRCVRSPPRLPTANRAASLNFARQMLPAGAQEERDLQALDVHYYAAHAPDNAHHPRSGDEALTMPILGSVQFSARWACC